MEIEEQFGLEEDSILMDIGLDEEAEGREQETAAGERELFSELGRYLESLYRRYSASQAFGDAIKIAKESRDYYDVTAEATNFPWPNASNIKTPLTRIAVDETEPRLVGSVVSPDPLVSFKALPNPVFGLTEDQMRTFGKVVEEFFDIVLKHEVKVEDWIPFLINNLLLDGTTYQLASWELEKRLVKQIAFGEDGQPIPGGPGSTAAYEKEEVERVVFEGVKVEVIPFEHVFLADDVDDEEWETRPVLVYRGLYNLAQLERMWQEQEGWVVSLEELAEEVAEPVGEEDTAAQQAAATMSDFEVLPDYLRPLECYLAFVKWRLHPEQGEEDLIVLVSKKSWRVLRILRQIDVVDDNLRPLRRQRMFPKQGLSWGKPLYHACKGLQICVDSLWNRCVNSADITITPWFFYRQSMAYEGAGNLTVSPGQGIGIPSIEDVLFPNLSQFNPLGFVPLIGQLITFWERVFNVSDYFQGRESAVVGKKGSTATGTLAVLQEGKVKHDYQGNRFKRQFEKLLELIFSLYKSNVREEKFQELTGDYVPLIMLHHPYTLILKSGDATTNRFMARQELESFVTGVAPMWDLFNPMFFAEQYSREYRYDPKETIDPELNRIVQQYRFVKAEGQKLAQMTGMPEEQARNVIAERGQTAEAIMQGLQEQVKGAAGKDEPGTGIG